MEFQSVKTWKSGYPCEDRHVIYIVLRFQMNGYAYDRNKCHAPYIDQSIG